MNTISAYVPDALATGFLDKLKLLDSLNLHCLETSQEELPLEQMPPEEVLPLRNLLYDTGCCIAMHRTRVSGLPPESLRRLLRNTHLMEIPSLLIDPEGCEEKEQDSFFRAASSFNLSLLVENRAGSALSTARDLETFLKLYQTYGVQIVFNPLEFVKLQQHPFFHVYYNSRMKNHIRVLRINDGLYEDGRPMPPAQGNGEIKELISITKARSFDGFFSLTPYLGTGTRDDLAQVAAWLRQTLKGL
jgi:hypothetical protein